jgi:hypothetical protein
MEMTKDRPIVQQQRQRTPLIRTGQAGYRESAANSTRDRLPSACAARSSVYSVTDGFRGSRRRSRAARLVPTRHPE